MHEETESLIYLIRYGPGFGRRRHSGPPAWFSSSKAVQPGTIRTQRTLILPQDMLPYHRFSPSQPIFSYYSDKVSALGSPAPLGPHPFCAVSAGLTMLAQHGRTIGLSSSAPCSVASPFHHHPSGPQWSKEDVMTVRE